MPGENVFATQHCVHLGSNPGQASCIPPQVDREAFQLVLIMCGSQCGVQSLQAVVVEHHPVQVQQVARQVVAFLQLQGRQLGWGEVMFVLAALSVLEQEAGLLL